jgi:amino acid transporter
VVSNTGTTLAKKPAPSQSHGEHGSNRLGAFLCWAVVFADIGTSVYYTPGILQSQVGKLAGLFVILTLVVFLLLTLKYAEVSVRFPEGGGVVTVAARGLNPWAGAVGGMFILVDYFLTSAISSLSGLDYLKTVIPAIAPYVLLITIIVVILLGVLNWYGIKESAIFSATIAVAAFVSDLLILLVVVLRVPPHIIGLVFQEMFSGRHLTVPIVLTGFAGAFLAFSGLESISQLSPVMKTPRHKTVTWALAFVVITVGVTSPLLTVFSTTLLYDPVVLHATAASSFHQAGTPDSTRLISILGQAYGGTIIGILTSVTASILLVFASNTAIIGAYHVFLALSRMQFFPKIVEKHNRLRGTPHVSIALATGIPLLVLIAVHGDVNILGDMYAFGLLGAFSLTCIALDVIRWRERHGEEIAGRHLDEDEVDDYADGGFRGQITSLLRARLSPQAIERLRRVDQVVSSAGQGVAQTAQPVTVRLKAWWPDIKYYLGFLTTALVGLAWLTNLKSKPLATAFGGGLTVLGVGIAVIHYRYQQRAGRTPVFVMSALRQLPRSLLVVLTATSEHNEQVIQAATESADGRTLVYLYLGQPIARDVKRLEFNDPYLFDQQAQATLSQAAVAAGREKVPAQFVYRTGGPNAVLDAWRIVRPAEIIADADTAKAISKRVAPQYVRFQQVDGVRIAHYVKHYVEGLATNRTGNGGAATANGPATVTAATNPTPPASTAGARADTSDSGNGNGKTQAEAGQLRNTFSGTGGAEPVQANGARPERTAKPATPPASQQPVADETNQTGGEDAQPSGGIDVSNYVWTGTSLVSREELAAQEAASNQQSQQNAASEHTAPQETPESPEREKGPEN